MPKLWVKFKNCRTTKVSSEDCEYVRDFICACRKKLSPRFDSISIAQLSISTTENGPPLSPGFRLTYVSSQPGYSENDYEHPLYIHIDPGAVMVNSANLFSISDAIPYVNDEEYKEYLKRGHLLKDAEETKEVMKAIEQLGGDDQTFGLIHVSSGTGKTQMAFNLIAAGYDVKHLICSKFGEPSRGQRIYQVFRSRSKIFQKVNEFVCEDYSYGFILSVLMEKTYDKESVSFSTLQKYIKDNEKELEKVVFFLDEFPDIVETETGDNTEYLQNLRDRIRKCGLKVLIASTNSSATKIYTVAVGSHSRGRDEPIVWCYVVPRLPKFVPSEDEKQLLASIPNNALKTFFTFLVLHSRPWFSLLVLSFVKDLTNDQSIQVTIDSFIHEVSTRVSYAKRSWYKNFLLGQLCLLLSATPDFLEVKLESGLIHRHFALLADQEPSFPLSNGYGELEKEGVDWIPLTCYPSCEDDLFLYLCMLGNQAKKQAKSLMCQVQDVSDLASFKFNVQDSNDGIKMQAIVSASMVRASRSNGVAGIGLIPFLSELLFELNATSTERPQYRGSFAYDCYSIPFLSTANVPFPNFMLSIDESVKIANCERIWNEDRMDFTADKGKFTAEVRDHKESLSSATFQDVLARIPPQSVLHLVITNQLQGKYTIQRGVEGNPPSPNQVKNYELAKENLQTRIVKQLMIYEDGTFSLNDLNVDLDALKKPANLEQGNSESDKPLVVFVCLYNKRCKRPRE